LALMAALAVSGALAQTGVRVVVVNEFANIRIAPAIGVEVLGTVPSGYIFEIVTARSPDNQWVRVEFNGEEGWVNVATLTVIAGDINTLPVADPRTIPYGGFESPRSGLSSASSSVTARLVSGLRVRAGPGRAYPVLADAPRNTVVPLLGRTIGNAWVQINFEGTLGWVAAQYLELLSGATIAQLPIDGIVADSLQPSEPVFTDYVDTLRLMLARVDLAQPSLDQIRAMWTDSALTGRAACIPYPARPSDYNIPNELLAAFYPTLNPLITLFNDSMANVRRAIDLFIEVCNQPGGGNPVGQATVIGALEIIALADTQFGELRRRLLEVIPPDLEPGPDECLFVFDNEAAILPIIRIGQLVRDNFTPDRIVTGYCFEAIAGQQLIFETLQLPGSTIVHLVAVSPFDNPTNFIGIGRQSAGEVNIGPVTMPITGRYLIVIAHDDASVLPNGEFAVLISDVVGTGGLNDVLNLDPVSGQIVITTPAAPILTTPGVVTTPGAIVPPITTTPSGVTGGAGSAGGAVCPGTGLTCEQLSSCQVAYACLAAGNFSLDPDADGVPCEISRCPSFP
jgi:uncharacterized protein YraI